jgi:hypothetical protein
MRLLKGLLAAASTLALTGQLAAQTVEIDTGVKACPAYDVLQQGIIDYLRGVDPAEAAGSEDPVAIEIILDASGSMEGRMDGRTKMEVAQAALSVALDALDGADALIGLRAYGFDDSVEKTPEASCPNTELLTGFARGDVADARAAADALGPYGYTPIAASLNAAADDLVALEARERVILLITDGEETCGGDPVAVAASLPDRGASLSSFVVGFDLDDAQADQMRAVAEAGGGRYLDAPDGDALAETLEEVVGVTVNKAERVMPRCSNPLQGGDSVETAILVEPGMHTGGELLEPGEYRYYTAEIAEGELARVRGLIQAWRYVDGAESEAGLAAMNIQIFDAEGDAAGNRRARARNLPGTGVTGLYHATEDTRFIFAIGDNYEALTPETLFELSILPAEPDEAGDLGADPQGEDVGELVLGESRRGRIGADDREDVWRLEAPGASVTLNFAAEDPEMRYRLSVFDETTGRRLARGDAPATVEVDGAVRILIENIDPGLAPRVSAYTLEAAASDE